MTDDHTEQDRQYNCLISISFLPRVHVVVLLEFFAELAFRLKPVVQVASVSSATFHVNLERSRPDFRQGWTVLSSFSPGRPTEHSLLEYSEHHPLDFRDFIDFSLPRVFACSRLAIHLRTRRLNCGAFFHLPRGRDFYFCLGG